MIYQKKGRVVMIEVKAVVFCFGGGNSRLVFPENGQHIDGTTNDVIKNAIEWKRIERKDPIGVFNDAPNMMDVGPAESFVYQW